MRAPVTTTSSSSPPSARTAIGAYSAVSGGGGGGGGGGRCVAQSMFIGQQCVASTSGAACTGLSSPVVASLPATTSMGALGKLVALKLARVSQPVITILP